jgi:signal transduction histidine kinase
MISQLLYILQNGWQRVQQSSKLLFLVVILFVFPVLFVVVLEQFYAVATANIATVEQSRTATLHDSVAAILPITDPSTQNNILQTLQLQNADIATFRVYSEGPDGLYTVIASSDENELNSTTSASTVLQLGKVAPNETFSVTLPSPSGRIEQSVRYIQINSIPYYIFSEQSKGQVDAVLTKRKQDAYIVLSLIFVFLIGLAYWVNRQTDWGKQYKKLHDTLEERDLFTNMVAHEFRTPLTAIKGYSSFLQDSESISGENLRYVDTIRESAERLVLLVNDFLEVARIQSGQMNINVTTVDVGVAIQSVVTSLSDEATQKELQLIYTKSLKPQLVTTDHNRLIQILTNIVSNSIKYTSTGTVEISCDVTHHGITIRVKDTGMGISAEDQQKLFKPFSRVGGVEHTQTTGTGLGMWITKQMIELLHGSIHVESIKGVGTHVVLDLQNIDQTD